MSKHKKLRFSTKEYIMAQCHGLQLRVCALKISCKRFWDEDTDNWSTRYLKLSSGLVDLAVVLAEGFEGFRSEMPATVSIPVLHIELLWEGERRCYLGHKTEDKMGKTAYKLYKKMHTH